MRLGFLRWRRLYAVDTAGRPRIRAGQILNICAWHPQIVFVPILPCRNASHIPLVSRFLGVPLARRSISARTLLAHCLGNKEIPVMAKPTKQEAKSVHRHFHSRRAFQTDIERRRVNQDNLSIRAPRT